nr:MAG TPA: tcix Putative treble-clef, zinc-finger, Zn-binding [Bacteriophage sp.]
MPSEQCSRRLFSVCILKKCPKCPKRHFLKLPKALPDKA